ncbi:NAD(P)/FAD-dependent oxidoreductase [Ketogulonicigenium vulgare]|uniref:NAD(P)/FAD-dependent oxidoreductase n=1 Tax=Ketogulonicigenium vulgare TaxID=92945 RepID=UPI0001E67B60|nr:FAD-dependent oxidoreductase [Ketogulonicigenium vulgare]ADO42732.1 FAD dependent oxidoreductase [Ketogulonicigenium vulgare Y25]ALJ81075.1 cyclopropane-fatty-acyl-phospholipid synthase [Ketogulonicigenium vulgare]ANW33830.1 cyclopropane-fatty-acyl-phospholipid synthase [Ketogulonicigenium vulgare]AOZ54644.1 FAD dependent oxidoreductase [Ketogulonicigenium vulgare]
MPFDASKGAPQRIAVIGGGISGLSSAYFLSRHHHVTVFEAEDRLGGHARTVMAGKRGDVAVDTGFIVFNYANYPHLTALFNALDVPVKKSNMSFAVSLDGGRVEFAMDTLASIFGQRRNMADPRFYGMLFDILRFNARAEAVITANPGLSIAGLIDIMQLGDRFRAHYLYALCGAIWSTPRGQIGDFPAEALLRFLRNHALLSAGGQHQWWTVDGGSIAYVSRLTAALQTAGVVLRQNTPIRAVTRGANGVTFSTHGDGAMEFDQVIFACHADQALALLTAPTEAERRALGAIQFQPNRAVLHRHTGVMPKRKSCWSAWVYRTDRAMDAERQVSISYWMNRLQGLPQDDPMFVTLNPETPIPEAEIYDEAVFRHPVFDTAALAAQSEIAALQGQNHTWFTGAWLRNGFHEDGCASAMRVARRLAPHGVTL